MYMKMYINISLLFVISGEPNKNINKDERHLCKICMDAEIDVVILPCNHMVCCTDCLLTQSKCPICRGSINHVIKPILL